KINNKNIEIWYNRLKDQRTITDYIFPKDKICIAVWDNRLLSKRINDKFNGRGFFICKKIGKFYEQICFGSAFNYDYFLEKLSTGEIFFDSGMYEGNNRNYSQFRAYSEFWNDLITDVYS